LCRFSQHAEFSSDVTRHPGMIFIKLELIFKPAHSAASWLISQWSLFSSTVDHAAPIEERKTRPRIMALSMPWAPLVWFDPEEGSILLRRQDIEQTVRSLPYVANTLPEFHQHRLAP
jgi:hypothetical protein